MRASLFLAVLGSFLLGTIVAAQPAVSPKPAPAPGKDLVAVLDLDGVNTGKGQLAALSDELRVRLLNTGKFRIVDRDQTNAILNEQAFQQEACASEDCAVKAGKLLGVRHLVTGRVTRIDGDMWQMTAQIVDVESSETLKAVSINQQGPFSALLSDGVPKVALELTAAAQAAGNMGAACKEDTKKLCADVKPGGGRIVKCLAKHRADLSPPCRDFLVAQRERNKKNAQDCRADAERLCANVKKGGGRIIACLKEHSADLSPACREDVSAR